MFTRKPVRDRHIDFLKSDENPLLPQKPSEPKSGIKRVFFVFTFVLLVIVVFSTRVIISGTEDALNLGRGGILTQLKNLIINRDSDVAGARENRINLLVLGIGGPGHEGAYLTDTIILVSLKPDDGLAALISIPRDLLVKSSVGSVKINSLYALGPQYNISGGTLIKEAVSDTFDLPIHYYGRIDFNGFIELIDTLDGIEIDVERSFVDYEFPAPNFKTKVVSFEAGLQYMDGTTALQFARSRHGNAGEGSDFARSRRQQKVLLAVKEKMLEKRILLRPDKIKKLIEILGAAFETDMELWEIVKFAGLTQSIKTDQLIQKILDDAPGGLLRPIVGYDGAFLLVPKEHTEMRSLAQNIFMFDAVREENAHVVIQNGTSLPGFADFTSIRLSNDGLTIVKVENADRQTYSETIIFDLSQGTKQKTLDYLQGELSGEISSYVPVELWQDNPQADFVVILGINNGLELFPEYVNQESPDLGTTPNLEVEET